MPCGTRVCVCRSLLLLLYLPVFGMSRTVAAAPVTSEPRNCQCPTVAHIARIAMRSAAHRTQQGGESSMPRKERRWSVRLVVADDDRPAARTTTRSSSLAAASPNANPYGGLVAVSSSSSSQPSAKQRQAHERTMMQWQTEWRATSDNAAAAAASTWSALTASVVAFGKRLMPFEQQQQERPAKKARRSFPVTRTAQFAPEDDYYYMDSEEDAVVVPKKRGTKGRRPHKTAPKAATAAATTGDYNHYRLSGGAMENKNQHPTTRAVSLVTMAVYDELESVLHVASQQQGSSSGDPTNETPPRVAYGDIGENFTLAGLASYSSVESSLVVGMRLVLGSRAKACPGCGGQRPDDNATEEHDKDDDDDDAPMIEICHVNNPCYRLNHVPWAARALKAVGGSMWCHPTQKKYGWWWSPQLPLNDVLHPGGRGYLCRVVKGGVVREGSAVTLVVPPSS